MVSAGVVSAAGFGSWRRIAAVSALAVLAGCSATPGSYDWDMRTASGVNTSEAARMATNAPPRPDSRGIISYPNYQVAVAQQGDTVTTVATRIGLPPQDLASYNALSPTDGLRQGEVLALPRRVAEPAGSLPAAAAPASGAGVSPIDVTAIATTALDSLPASPAPAAPAPQQGAEPLRHKVVRGETAYSIARSYDVSAKALADWNGLGADLAVREGQYLIIPTAAPGAQPPARAEDVLTEPGSGSPTPLPPSASEPLPSEQPQRASEPAKGTPDSPNLASERTAASAATLAMPVNGKIVSVYKKKVNDGIDIAAAPGTAVKAAAAGTVAAITKDTDNTPIIVIRHADNLLTVYAGVDGVKVAKGANVSRGQTIAVVGSGNVHFEVRKGIDSVDPMPFLQ